MFCETIINHVDLRKKSTNLVNTVAISERNIGKTCLIVSVQLKFVSFIFLTGEFVSLYLVYFIQTKVEWIMFERAFYFLVKFLDFQCTYMNCRISNSCEHYLCLVFDHGCQFQSIPHGHFENSSCGLRSCGKNKPIDSLSSEYVSQFICPHRV